MRNLSSISTGILFSLLFLFQFSFSQDLTLQSGAVNAEEMLIPSEKIKPYFADKVIDGKYHLVLQFASLPTTAQQAELHRKGIRLFSYLPEKAYLALVKEEVNWDEMPKAGITHIFALQSRHKLSSQLADHQYPAHALIGQDIQLRVQSYPDIALAKFSQLLAKAGYQAEQDIDLPGALQVTVPLAGIDKLAALPSVMYVEAGAAPAIPDGLRGRTSHRANWLSQKPGTGYDGTGVVMAVADDGGVDHIDFTGRLTDHTSGQGGTHGDMTGGIAAGAGNVDPTAAGMGTGAYLHMYGISGYPQINNAISNFNTLGTVITSTSYSQGCGGIYEGTAQSLDQGVDSIPELLHVFSAGNSASSSCSQIYGSITDAGGRRYGNITGGRKAAKHSIATANMEYDDDRTLSSSRGPCEDGRLKPDISAHGTGQISTNPNNTYRPGGGTSAAAPGIAGVSTMLYQAYKDMNNGQNPSHSLIKSVLLNSADDLGRPGPDYDFGWGRVNARKALEVLEEAQYSTDNVSQNDTNTHTLVIPAGVKKVKVMLYWHDPAGSPLASKALVNDLDLTLKQGSSIWRPWILSTFAHIDSLQHNAWRGEDRVNNMEQVTLDNPGQGSYTIEVVGEGVPMGPQSYHINYVFIYDEIIVNYPRGGESFVPGVEETIRWEAFGNTGNFQLDYSLNNGQTWQALASNINGSRRFYDWEVDSVLTGDALVRVRRGGMSGISDRVFSIMEVPSNVRMAATSLTDGELRWDPVPGATVYDVFVLGSMYMDSIGSTTTTSYGFSNLVQGPNFWVSVRARDSVDNIVGRRVLAREYDHNPVSICSNCAFAVNTYPYTESFENGLGSWCQFFNDDIDWTLWSGGTPSNNTGPQSAINGSNYIYIEATNPNFPEKTATIGSPCFDLSNFAKGHFTFSYHMFGFSMGDIYLEASVDSGLTWSSPIWTKSGDQGNQWRRDSIDLNPYIGGVVAFRFKGETGNNYASDIAIDHIVIKEDPACANFAVQGNATDISCHGADDGEITLTASGGSGGYIYNWQQGSTTAGLTNLSKGYYEVEVEDGNGCKAVRRFWVREPAPLQIQFQPTAISCFGGNNGEINATILGGNGGNGFVWSNGGQSSRIFGLTAGTYTLLVADSKGCTEQGSYTLTNPAPIVVNFNTTDPLCFGDSSGSIQLILSGVQGPASFNWSSGQNSQNITGLRAGNYSLSLTDSLGCIGTGSTMLQNPPAISLQLQGNPVSCFGYQDGSANGVAFGGAGNFQYQWINGPNTPSRSNLTAGTYALRVTDNNGCVKIDSIVITEPPQLTISAVGLDVKCFGDSTGRAVASGSGGTVPYSYLWSTGQTSSTINGLPKGNFVVTVTDANNCQTNQLVSINQPNPLQLSITATDESAPGASDGTATPILSGGTPPYTQFQWSNGGTDSLQNALAAGVYTVTVKDANGCTIMDSVIVGSLNSLSDRMTVEAFKLYPNPSDDHITIEFLLRSREQTEVKIYDALGRLIWEKGIVPTGVKQQIKLDISSWAEGSYFLRIENQEEQASTRFIKY